MQAMREIGAQICARNDSQRQVGWIEEVSGGKLKVRLNSGDRIIWVDSDEWRRCD